MKNFDRLIVPGCEEAVERQNASNTCRIRDPRCDDPVFAQANPSLCGIDPRCQDRNFATAHPEICGPSTDRLIIKPANLTLCEGKTMQLRTFIVRGTVETEVAAGLTYQSSNQEIASIGAIGGSVTGVSDGVVDISVEWMGKRAYSRAQVLPGADCCEDLENRIVLLLDISASAGVEFGGAYATKLSFAKAAARKFAQSVDLTKDSVAVHAFSSAGLEVTGFSQSLATIEAAIDGLSVTGNKTNVGDGFADAVAAVNAAVGPGDRKVVVIFSDFENKLGVDPVPLAQQFFDSGGIVIVVGVRANGAGYVLGNRMATGGFFINAYAANVEVALSSLDGVKAYFCSGTCIPQGDVYASRPALNYGAFTNWDIAFGTMDLIGQGSDGVSSYDLIPGNGLYVDRAGSGPVFSSIIQTKQAFSFVPGNQYRLTLKYAGNQRSQSATGHEILNLGDVLVDERIDRAWNQNFTDEVFEFTVSTATDAKLMLEYFADGADNPFGFLLDIVRLENLTTGQVMFLETWDNENTRYIPPGCGPGNIYAPQAGGGYGYAFGYYCDYTDCVNIPPPTQSPDPIIAPDIEDNPPPVVYTSTKACSVSCPEGTSGPAVERTATATSLVSQADADAKATVLACAAATAALECECEYAVGSLVNVNFNPSVGEGETMPPDKTGMAAIGNSPSDYWNNVRTPVGVSLKDSSACLTGLGLSVSQYGGRGLGHVSNLPHPDAMMQSSLSAFDAETGSPTLGDPKPTAVLVEGLPIGEYEIYIYAHNAPDSSNSQCSVVVGSTVWGPIPTVNGPGAQSANWIEGNQYVRIRFVVATAGDDAHIIADLGADGVSRLNGFQLRWIGEGPTGTAITIDDHAVASPYPSTRFVSGFNGFITKVTVGIEGFIHPFPKDVDVMLVGPDGTHVILFADAGPTLGYNSPGVDFTLDDSGADPDIPQNAAVVSGNTYKTRNYETAVDPFEPPAPPAPHAANLTAFNGKGANGAWRLYVVDDTLNDFGSIANWTLDIETTVPAPEIDVLVEAVQSAGSVPNGGFVDLFITVRNIGAIPATNVILAGHIDTALIFNFFSWAGPSGYSGTGQDFSINLGTIAPGAFVTATSRVRAIDTGDAVVALNVEADQTDPNLSNNDVEKSLTST